MQRITLFLITVGFSSAQLFAQGKLTVQVTTAFKEPLSKAQVIWNGSLSSTDNNGLITLESKVQDNALEIMLTGYKSTVQSVKLLGDQSLVVLLLRDDTLLEDIVITNTSEGKSVHRDIVKSLKVNTKSVTTRPTSLTEVMNSSTGIRVRESGGLGSQINVNLNGFQGQAIRFFKDGIPLNYLGEGYSLSNVPVDVLDGVEVYKGIVPLHLASDALGGAVNLLSSNQKANGGKVSLTYGSFNTWRGAVRLHHNINDYTFVGIESFYNYSDNDYKIKNPDEHLAKTQSHVKLFHNRYQHAFANAYVGWHHLRWADLLRLDLSFYTLDKEVQHSPASMTIPYGAVKHKQQSFIPSLRFKKGLLNDRITLDQFLSYNVIKSRAIDTLKGTYNWSGHFTSSGIRGEGEHPTNAYIDTENFTARTLIGYTITNNHQAWLNNSFQQIKREGHDEFGKQLSDTKQDILEIPTQYKKNVLAVGITSQWFANQFETTLALKHYAYHSQGLNTAYTANLHSDHQVKTSGDAWGWALGAKYAISDDWTIRTAVEDARRLPSVPEIFGDNLFIASNFDLKPEQSINVNLAMDYTAEKWSYSLSGFYRKTNDIIVLVSGNPPLSVYVNKEKAIGYGFEGDVSFKLNEQYKFFGNFTWQSIRYGAFTNYAEQWMKNARVPNIPYFFANIGAEGQWKQLLTKEDALTVYTNLNFVREFYIQPIPKSQEPGGLLGLFGNTKGDVKNIVPDQTLVNLGMLYSLNQQGLSLGVEVKNALNQAMYDYFKIQKAGRSVYVKLNYKF